MWVTDLVPQMVGDMDVHPDEIISAGTIYHMQEHCSFHPGFITDPKVALKDCIVEDYQTQPRSYDQRDLVKTVNMQATFACLYKRDWLMEINGWDEEFKGCWGWDDIDLATRLRINGINQHIYWDVECIHQWHPHPPHHIMGEGSRINEAHMRSKRLDLLEKGDPGLIANKEKEWGIIKPRV